MNSTGILPSATIVKEEIPRREYLGASEIAAVLGLSKWASPLSVFYDKTREPVATATDEQSEWQEWGNRLEPIILDAYKSRTLVTDAETLWAKPPQVRSLFSPWQACTPDGLVLTAPVPSFLRGVDAKNVDRSQAGKWGPTGTDQIPESYLLQMQYSMEVTGLRRWDVAALIGGNSFGSYVVEYDAELMAIVMPRLEAFWDRVLRDDPPEATAADNEHLKHYLKNTRGEILADHLVIGELAPQLLTAKAARDEAQTMVDYFEARLKQEIGTYAGAMGPWGSISYKHNKDGTKIDTAAVIADLTAEAVAAMVKSGLVEADARQYLGAIVARHTRVTPGPRVFRPTIHAQTGSTA